MIGNMAVLADKEFQNLSVTAHNWVEIIEVKPKELVHFFEDKRKDGYR